MANQRVDSSPGAAMACFLVSAPIFWVSWSCFEVYEQWHRTAALVTAIFFLLFALMWVWIGINSMRGTVIEQSGQNTCPCCGQAYEGPLQNQMPILPTQHAQRQKRGDAGGS